MKQILRNLLGVKTPEQIELDKKIRAAKNEAYTSKMVTYAKQLGEDKADAEYQREKAKFSNTPKKGGFNAWLLGDTKEDSK